jgi:hypothetical protein
MRAVRLSILIIALIAGSACSALSPGNSSLQTRPIREKSILLPAEKAKELTSQCSRKGPERFSGTWNPTARELTKMEANFEKIIGLKSNPESYFMQYVGLLIDGKKVIYINAFRNNSYTAKNWKTTPIIVCDGGDSFWGIVYDLQKEEFFDLAVNGEA